MLPDWLTSRYRLVLVVILIVSREVWGASIVQLA
jgi:hypothetical protein